MKTLFKLRNYPSMTDEKTFPEEVLQQGYQKGNIETSSYYLHVPNTVPGSGKKLGFYEWLYLYNLRVA